MGVSPDKTARVKYALNLSCIGEKVEFSWPDVALKL